MNKQPHAIVIGSGFGGLAAAVRLGARGFRVTVLDHWQSPRTGTRYPARWRVTVPSADIDLEVRPLAPAQENVSELVERLHYWEGAVEVLLGGRRAGEGYVELTGYGADARLPL